MQKILIANRGEIAIRVMKTCKKMGIKTVAVYSDVDRTASHVLFADEAIYLGPAPSNQSYLLGDKIIQEALKLGVNGIHPGYGFLSENALFAQKVIDAGMKFIGPSPQTIESMGSKIAAKEIADSVDVPMVPGTKNAITDQQEALSIATKIGFPILIKASAGGGGKGMRIVHEVSEFLSQLERASSEALASFGDGSVFIEKYVENPRHIEIQILGDQMGNIVHLFERECSIQRRHQKLIEEAPSSLLTPHLRKEMGDAAIRLAKACNYTSAGTVEFLVDKNNNFYFLEVNTRLQVEHPVTEFITGVDLVEQQIKIAQGQPLPFTQNELKISGHAMELRVCAEDPFNDFLPSIGVLETYNRPSGLGIRVDDGMDVGQEISVYYDPMIAKLIVHGSSRREAIYRLLQAIKQYEINGVETTLEFGTFVLNNPHFIAGDFDTHFIQNYFKPENILDQKKSDYAMVSKVAVLIASNQYHKLSPPTAFSTNWSKNTRE